MLSDHVLNLTCCAVQSQSTYLLSLLLQPSQFAPYSIVIVRHASRARWWLCYTVGCDRVWTRLKRPFSLHTHRNHEPTHTTQEHTSFSLCVRAREFKFSKQTSLRILHTNTEKTDTSSASMLYVIRDRPRCAQTTH